MLCTLNPTSSMWASKRTRGPVPPKSQRTDPNPSVVILPKEVIVRNLENFRKNFENAVIDALRKRWTTLQADFCFDGGPSPLGLEKLVSLFSMVGFASILAVVIFALEHIVKFTFKSRDKREVRKLFAKQRRKETEFDRQLNKIMTDFEIDDREEFAQYVARTIKLAKKVKF